MSRRARIVQFFDEIAERYAGFYISGKATLHKERLKLACLDIEFRNQRVLDLGAGTGALFDHIQRNGGCRSYTAVDISRGMLAQSKIPESDRVVGHFLEAADLDGRFDLIFALGLTNYLSESELDDLERLLRSKSKGKVILSFTNKNNFQNQLRIILRPLLSSLSNRSIGAPFTSFMTTSKRESDRWNRITEFLYFSSFLPGQFLAARSPEFAFWYSDFIIKIDTMDES
jgi:SAM-dependent methyltransferase